MPFSYIINAKTKNGNGKRVIFLKILKKFLSVALTTIISVYASAIPCNSGELPRYVYLGGEPFGLKMYTDGVMIVELESYFDGSRYVCPAKDGGLRESDVIKEINGTDITSNEKLREVTLNSDGNTLDVTLEREEKMLSKQITPVKNTAGNYLIGAWVRDSSAGIGTVTYYDSEQSYFAGLGHGICDCDTNTLMPLASGEAVVAEISSVTKSTNGSPGSLNGYFSDRTIGEITKNCDIGLYGTFDNSLVENKEKIQVAQRSELKKGKATVYTTIEGNSPQPYEIEITGISRNKNSNESFTVKITDYRLLEKSGGIVQGMSGSPIVMDGKLVGAVTHVFINSTNEGYGIYIGNMMEKYE